MPNVSQFNSNLLPDGRLTAAASPVILDFQAALATPLLRALLICDGPGTISVASSNDGGSTFTPDFPLRSHEIIGEQLGGNNQVRLTHTGVDSSYRILGQAGARDITFTRPSPTMQCSPLTHHHETDSGEVQIASGPGYLDSLYNTKAQKLSVWDFDGAGPADSDLFCEFDQKGDGHITFGFPFVNGLRIDSQGMGMTLHFQLI